MLLGLGCITTTYFSFYTIRYGAALMSIKSRKKQELLAIEDQVTPMKLRVSQ
jgi:hypothetical protein